MLLLALERRVCFTLEDLALAAPAYAHLRTRFREGASLRAGAASCSSAEAETLGDGGEQGAAGRGASCSSEEAGTGRDGASVEAPGDAARCSSAEARAIMSCGCVCWEWCSGKPLLGVGEAGLGPPGAPTLPHSMGLDVSTLRTQYWRMDGGGDRLNR